MLHRVVVRESRLVKRGRFKILRGGVFFADAPLWIFCDLVEHGDVALVCNRDYRAITAPIGTKH